MVWGKLSGMTGGNMPRQSVHDLCDNYRFSLWKKLEMGEFNLTPEQEKLCREYLEAWDKWTHASRNFNRNIKWPIPFVMIGFPIWLVILIWGDKHCGKLWDDLDAKQKRWEDCLVAKNRGTNEATC